MSYDGIVFFEGGILGGIIVYASEIAADPYATFSILVEGINGIVRQGIVIVGIVGEVLDFPGFLVVSVYSSFCGNPQCFCRWDRCFLQRYFRFGKSPVASR